MNRKGIIFVFSILFLFIGVYSIGNGLLFYSNPSNTNNNAKKPIAIISSPKSSGESWYRKGDCTNYDIFIVEMDTYNKTGDVYLIGYNETGGTSDIFLVKYNATGNQQWKISLNGGFDSNYGADLVVNQSSGEIYIVGSLYNGSYSYSDVFIAKYMPNGDQAWNISWDFKSHTQYGSGIALDNKGNLYITGSNSNPAYYEIIIAKFSLKTLKEEWNATWHNLTPKDEIWEYAKDITCGHYGNIYITGQIINTSNFENDMVLICFDENGAQKWNVTYDLSTYNTFGDCVAVDSNDDVYIVGYTEHPSTFSGYMVLRKYSNQSNFIWGKSWSGEYGYGKGNDIYIDSEDNVIVAVNGIEFPPKLRVVGYNPVGTQILNLGWRSNSLNSNEELISSCVSGFGTNYFYIAGSTKEGSSGCDTYILVRNPSSSTVDGGVFGWPPGDDDDDDDNGGTDEIPSYNLYILFGIICICSVILTKKIYKRL